MVNGAHDLGGMHGMGKIIVEQNEPVFHSEWEKVVFAISFATPCTGDEFRYGIEKMNAVEYLSSRYYEHWLHGLENILIEKGIVDRHELDSRTKRSSDGSFGELQRVENPKLVENFLRSIKEGFPSNREVERSPKFSVGDLVITKNINPASHTRLPRYARGKSGVIDKVHEAFVFPDSNAIGMGENPQYLYTVRFESKAIWGEESSEKGAEAIYLDLWESYLDHDK